MEKENSLRVVIMADELFKNQKDESVIEPKAMMEVGGKPLLWHTMSHYYNQGFRKFIICTWYKGYQINEYFKNYYYHNSDVSYHLGKETILHNKNHPAFKVTVVSTERCTSFVEQLKYVTPYLKGQGFILTNGNVLSSINLKQMAAEHAEKGKLVTSAVIRSYDKKSEEQKPGAADESLIDSGIYIMSRVSEFIKDNTLTQKEVLEEALQKDQINKFVHKDFYTKVDKRSAKADLDKLWYSGEAPWKTWTGW